MMNSIFRILTILVVLALPLSALGAKEPIYINFTTNDPDKVLLALEASKPYSDNAYPLVIFLNDKAVNIGVVSKSGAESKGQLALYKSIADGAKVIICPSCLEIYGYTSKDLIPGIVLGAVH